MGCGTRAPARRIMEHKVDSQLGQAAVRIFAANDRMNQMLIEHLDPAAWTAKPPGKVRTIAAIFTHFSLGAPSRPGVHARASARVPAAGQGDVRDLELGKALG